MIEKLAEHLATVSEVRGGTWEPDRIARRLVDEVVHYAGSHILPCKELALDVWDFFQNPANGFRAGATEEGKGFYLPREIRAREAQDGTRTTTLLDVVRETRGAGGLGQTVLLLGESGVGKTTEQLRVAFAELRGLSSDPERHRIPIIIQDNYPLLEAADDRSTNILSSLIGSAWGLRDVDAVTVADVLPPCLILLDISELPATEQQFENALTNIRRFSRDNPRHLVVVAYRTSALRNERDPVQRQLESHQQRSGIRAYVFSELSPDHIGHYLRSVTGADELDVRIDPGLQAALARSPMMLHLYAQVAVATERLSRGQIYGRFVQKMSAGDADEQFEAGACRLAAFMCRTRQLSVSRAQAEKLLGADVSPDRLTELGILTIRLRGGHRRYGFFHDSFAFYFAALELVVSVGNDFRKTKIRLQEVVFEHFTPEYQQALMYLPGILQDRDCDEFPAWFREFYRIINRAVPVTIWKRVDVEWHQLAATVAEQPASGGWAAVAVNLGGRLLQKLNRVPFWYGYGSRTLRTLLLEQAYHLLLETGELADILAHSLGVDDDLRYRIIEQTVNAFDQQAMGPERPPSELPALKIISHLGKEVRAEWHSVGARRVLLMMLKHQARLRPSTLGVRLESLFTLLIVIIGRHLVRPERNPEITRFFLEEGNHLHRNLLSSDRSFRKKLILAAATHTLESHYRQNGRYPCNNREMELALQGSVLTGSGNRKGAELIRKSGELFQLTGTEFTARLAEVRVLAGASNGLITWYASTLLSTFGRDPASRASVFELLDGLAGDALAIDCSSYVAVRALHSLSTFDPNPDPLIVELFERLSRRIILQGRWVQYGNDSARRYDNEALLYFGEYLCSRGREEQFRELMVERLEEAADRPEEYRYCLDSLAFIGRRREHLPMVLSVIQQLQGGGRTLIDDQVACIANALESMLPYNPVEVRAALDQSDTRVREAARPKTATAIQIQYPVNYFGDAIYQNLLCEPRVRQSFGKATVRGSRARTGKELIRAYVDAVVPELDDLKPT